MDAKQVQRYGMRPQRRRHTTYTLVRCVAHTETGDVFFAQADDTGEEVAIEVIDLEDMSLEDIKQGAKRIAMHAHNQIPHMKTFYGAYMEPNSSKLCHITEFMDFSVADILKTHLLSETAIAELLHTILMALRHLHSKGIVHRDVKASCIYFNSKTGAIKLNPFCIFQAFAAREGQVGPTVMKMPYWEAPESISGGEEKMEVSTAADIWSIGITAIEMAIGTTPYASDDPLRAIFRIKSDDPVPIPKQLSKSFREFVSLCLQKDPEQRPNVNALLKHKFFRANKGPRFVDYLNDLKGQRRVIALTPRVAVIHDHGHDEAFQWDFGGAAPCNQKSLVGFLLDTIISEMKTISEEEEEDGDGLIQSIANISEQIEDLNSNTLHKLDEKLTSAFQNRMNENVTQDFRRFSSEHNMYMKTMAYDVELKQYLRLGLFSKFVIKRWKDNLSKDPAFCAQVLKS